MINIRLPNITALDERGKLEQIRSYLYQFAQELNWALGTIDGKTAEAVQKIEAAAMPEDKAQQAQATFLEVKSLIIKSADIVNAYSQEISRRLEGQYVAQSDFGIFAQETSASLEANSEGVSLLFDNQQSIQTEVDSIRSALHKDRDGTTILGAEAWCKIGVLGYEDSGFPIYGMEIGQHNQENGVTTYKKFAQYRSDGVHLFDQNGIEVATISDYKLRITNAQITGSLKLGGYIMTTENGVAIKWEGK